MNPQKKTLLTWCCPERIVIIFSKSYCPHSKKAKIILRSKYTINPAPYVVELDQHPLGLRLQDALEKSTGRRTVPNVLINGKSIGGGDEVEALDVGGDLIAKVKSMGGKRIVEAKLAS
jgi:glutaredoxin